jgi:hypothetical protein
MDYPETPELNKAAEQRKALKTQHIGVFLEWLSAQGAVIASWGKDEYDEDRLIPIPDSIEQLLADYSGVDLQKMENEKRAILEVARANATER